MIKPRILSIGEVLWDLLPDGARFGGAAANFACHAAILGGDISIVSAVGNDELFEVAKAFDIPSSLTTTETLQTLREKCGLNLVVLTRGAVGALLVSDQGTIDQSGIPAKVVDTVGAGDCFIATFLLGLLRGEPHQDILRKACDKASAVCAYSGAIPS